MSFRSPFLPLESRLLCSSTPLTHEEPKPPTTVDPAVLEADRAVIATALATLMADYSTNTQALAAARQARATDAANVDAQLKTLRLTVSADQKAIASLGPTTEAATKALRTKWAAIISPEELDVKTNTEGESADERAADAAKLAADRAAAMAELGALNAKAKADREAATLKLKTDLASIEMVRKAGEAQLKADQLAISLAERTLKTVFASDRKILEADVALYRKHGGKVDELHLPVLPKA